MQFYQTKKILGPKIKPPNFQALISPRPEIFPWRIIVRISKCLWLVYLSYHPLNFTFSHLTVWTARPALYACGTTPIRLFWIPFEIPTYIKPPKMSLVCLFSKFSYPQRNPVMNNFKTKKKSLSHLGNFNSPLPFQPPPRAGPRVRYYCLRCSFWLLVVVRHFSPFLCLSWFLSVWKYPNALCNCIAICCIRPV